MVVSIAMGVHKKWMVYFMEIPIAMDDDWGYPPISGNPHIDL